MTLLTVSMADSQRTAIVRAGNVELAEYKLTLTNLNAGARGKSSGAVAIAPAEGIPRQLTRKEEPKVRTDGHAEPHGGGSPIGLATAVGFFGFLIAKAQHGGLGGAAGFGIAAGTTLLFLAVTALAAIIVDDVRSSRQSATRQRSVRSGSARSGDDGRDHLDSTEGTWP